MKLSIVVTCCFLLTINYSVDGGLVKDFFGKVKETAEVVHKDIHDIWRPNKANTDNNTEHAANTPQAGDKENNLDGKGDAKVSDITPSPSITVTKENEVKNDKQEEIQASTPTSTVAIEKHDETTTVATSTTTVKDGRANFSGACQTNYRRTADGRCRPVAA